MSEIEACYGIDGSIVIKAVSESSEVQQTLAIAKEKNAVVIDLRRQLQTLEGFLAEARAQWLSAEQAHVDAIQKVTQALVGTPIPGLPPREALQQTNDHLPVEFTP